MKQRVRRVDPRTLCKECRPGKKLFVAEDDGVKKLHGILGSNHAVGDGDDFGEAGRARTVQHAKGLACRLVKGLVEREVFRPLCVEQLVTRRDLDDL